MLALSVWEPSLILNKKVPIVQIIIKMMYQRMLSRLVSMN